MVQNIDREIVSTIVGAVIYREAGASLEDIVAGFPERPDPRKARQWVAVLLEAGILEQDEAAGALRYYATVSASEYLPATRRTVEGSGTTTVASSTEKSLPAVVEPVASSGPSVAASSIPSVAAVVDATRYQSLFDAVLCEIVAGVMPRTSALARLQMAALPLPDGERKPFVHYATERLLHLTLGDALRHGVEPPQYEAWRREYFGAPLLPAAPGTNQPVESTAPTVASSDAKSPRYAASTVARRANSGEPSVVQAAAGSVAPPSRKQPVSVAEAVAQPSSNASAPSLDGLLNAVAPSLDTLSVRRSMKPVVSAVASFVVLLVVLSLNLIGCPLWLVTTVALTASAGLVGVLCVWSRKVDAAQTTHPATPLAPVRSWRAVRRTVIGAVALVIVAASVIGYVQARRRPSVAAVSEYLTTNLAPLPVRVAAINVTFGPAGAAGCQVHYQALLETTEPLVRRLETTAYLRAHAPAEATPIDAARALLAGPNGARLRRAAPVVVPAPAIEDLVLVTTQTPPGATAPASGTLTAWRRDGAWIFTGDAVRIDRAQLAGDALAVLTATKSSAASTVFVVDLPTDAARLKTLLDDHAAYAAKVKETAESSAASPNPETQSRNADAKQIEPLPAAPGNRSIPDTRPPTLSDAEPGRAATANRPPSAAAPTTTTPAPSAPGMILPDPDSGTLNTQPSALNPAFPSTAASAPLPPLPVAPGAYVLIDRRWVPLPRNHAQRIESVVPVSQAQYGSADFQDAVEAGRSPDGRTATVVELIFEGSDPVPTVPAADLVLAWVGPVDEPTEADRTHYPMLRTYPAVELAPTKALPSGVRNVVLFPIAPGFHGFGSRRVPATTEHPRPDVLLLHCTRAPTPGPYAFACGTQAYEMNVRN